MNARDARVRRRPSRPRRSAMLLRRASASPSSRRDVLGRRSSPSARVGGAVRDGASRRETPRRRARVPSRPRPRVPRARRANAGGYPFARRARTGVLLGPRLRRRERLTRRNRNFMRWTCSRILGCGFTSDIPRDTRRRTSWRSISVYWGTTSCTRWMGRVRFARRTVRHGPNAPERDDEDERRTISRAVAKFGFFVRLGQRGGGGGAAYYKWARWIFLRLLERI